MLATPRVKLLLFRKTPSSATTWVTWVPPLIHARLAAAAGAAPVAIRPGVFPKVPMRYAVAQSIGLSRAAEIGDRLGGPLERSGLIEDVTLDEDGEVAAVGEGLKIGGQPAMRRPAERDPGQYDAAIRLTGAGRAPLQYRQGHSLGLGTAPHDADPRHDSAPPTADQSSGVPFAKSRVAFLPSTRGSSLGGKPSPGLIERTFRWVKLSPARTDATT